MIQTRPENASFVVTRDLTYDETQLFMNPMKKGLFHFVDQEQKKK